MISGSFIYKLFNSPHKLMEEYKKSVDYRPALVWVLLTASSFVGFGIAGKYGNGMNTLVGFAVIIATYFAACLAFKIAAAVTHKKVKYMYIMSTWGHSYIATFTFMLYLILSHTLFLPSNSPNSSVTTFISMTILIALLIWKVVFYFIELVTVLGENIAEVVISSLVIGTLFVLYYIFTVYVIGFKVPIV